MKGRVHGPGGSCGFLLPPESLRNQRATSVHRAMKHKLNQPSMAGYKMFASAAWSETRYIYVTTYKFC